MKRFLLLFLTLLLMPVISSGYLGTNLEIWDVPTANNTIQGEIRGDFKFYPPDDPSDGIYIFSGVLYRFYIGIFDQLSLGFSSNVHTGFLGRYNICEDDGEVPSIAIGYDSVKYYNLPSSKGIYMSVSKGFDLGDVYPQVTLSVYNNNEFNEPFEHIDMGGGITFEFLEEFIIGAEIDGICRNMYRNFNATVGVIMGSINISIAAQHNMSADLNSWQPLYRMTVSWYI